MYRTQHGDANEVNFNEKNLLSANSDQNEISNKTSVIYT